MRRPSFAHPVNTAGLLVATPTAVFAQVSIRGSDNDQVLVLPDGIELGGASAISTEYVFDHL